MSFVCLALLTLWVLAIPWHRFTNRLRLIVALGYLPVAALLMLSQREAMVSGLPMAGFIPIVWSALYLRRLQTLLVACFTGVSLASVAFVSGNTQSEIGQRLILWLVTSGLICIGTHALRHQLTCSRIRSRDRARQMASLMRASTELTALYEVDSMIDVVLRYVAQIVCPRSNLLSVEYLRIQDADVTVARVHSEPDESVLPPLSLATESLLRHSVERRSAQTGPIEHASTSSKAAKELGDVHGLFLPVMVAGNVNGVIAIRWMAQPLSTSRFRACASLANMLELALDNASSHARLRLMATTDALTGLVNRRGVEGLRRTAPGNEYAVLAVDVDNLKRVNDTYGHSEGDLLLIEVANVLAKSIRNGDMAGRIGGDEFIVVLNGADESQAVAVGKRILGRLEGIRLHGECPHVSIGIASGAAVEYGHLVDRADVAMYAAKAAGGARYVLASEEQLPGAREASAVAGHERTSHRIEMKNPSRSPLPSLMTPTMAMNTTDGANPA